MATDSHPLENFSIHPASLEFGNGQLELEYQQYFFQSLKRQARISLILGLALWLFYCLLDYLFVPSGYLDTIWNIRITVMCFVVLAFITTLLPIFRRFNQKILTVLTFINAVGLLAIMRLLLEVASSYYFPGLILAIIWSHSFSGLRFIYASFTSVVILIAFNFLFIIFHPMPIADLVSNNFYIVATITLAISASYLSERQSRILFLQERKLDNERQHQLNRALHDSLTGLPNRDLLHDRLEQAISQASRDERPCAGLFIDLDGFKSINDMHGHDAGDLVLKEVAARFKDIMREADTLSRIGGDEFFVLARDIHTADAAKILADKLLHQLQAPFVLNDETTLPGMTASIGACLFPYKYCTPIDVIRRADQAMYEVKRGDKAGMAFASLEDGDPTT